MQLKWIHLYMRLLLCSFCVWHINIKVQFHLKLLSHFRRIRHYASRHNVQQTVNDWFMEKSFIIFYYYWSTIFRWLASQSIKLSYRIVLLYSLARRGFVELADWVCWSWLMIGCRLGDSWRDMQNWKMIDPLRRMAIKIHFLSNCHHEQQLISSTFSWLQMCPL